MFEHLKSLEIGDKTSWCVLPDIGEGAALNVRPATAENRDFTNALLQRAAGRPRGKSSTAEDPASLHNIDEARADARAIYPKWIVTGWRGIVDQAGAEVAFTVENCADLFRNLPDGLIDQIMGHSVNRANFLLALKR